MPPTFFVNVPLSFANDPGCVLTGLLPEIDLDCTHCSDMTAARKTAAERLDVLCVPMLVAHDRLRTSWGGSWKLPPRQDFTFH
jgi:broad specificity phosphatase PhoE